jgi:hypothetical protein
VSRRTGSGLRLRVSVSRVPVRADAAFCQNHGPAAISGITFGSTVHRLRDAFLWQAGRAYALCCDTAQAPCPIASLRLDTSRQARVLSSGHRKRCLACKEPGEWTRSQRTGWVGCAANRALARVG